MTTMKGKHSWERNPYHARLDWYLAAVWGGALAFGLAFWAFIIYIIVHFVITAL